MMKNILSKKVIMLVSALSISGLLLTGCSSANKNDVAQASTQNQQSQQGQQGNSNFAANAEERKKQMETDVNALVSDGTLTKDQGTKVLEALTTLNQRPNGQGRGNNAQGSQGTQNNNQGSTTQNGENSQQGQGTKNGNGTKSNRGNFNPLSKLVSDGVITQDQATKVMEKVRADMPNRQRQNNNGNNSNSNSNGTNNNSSSSTGSSS